jgi:secondary thiamine-phosphate synthase enzyme
MIRTIQVQSRSRDDWIDVTETVRQAVRASALADGVVTVFIPHTTAGVTIQENADPPLKADITRALDRVFPWRNGYGHCEDNAAAHMKACYMGTSTQVVFRGHELVLGTWQNVYLCEFDGPRQRSVVIKLSP